jgi:FANCL UBC-like domain 1
MSTETQHLIVPVNAEATAYEGFLSIPEAGHLQTSLWIRMIGVDPQKRTLENARLEVSEEFSDLLQVCSQQL